MLVQSHNNSVFVSDFTCFARFMAFTADTLYENMNKTRKVRKRVHFACTARMSRIRTRAQYCEYRFIHFRYRLIRGIMLCFNYKNGKEPF